MRCSIHQVDSLMRVIVIKPCSWWKPMTVVPQLNNNLGVAFLHVLEIVELRIISLYLKKKNNKYVKRIYSNKKQ